MPKANHERHRVTVALGFTEGHILFAAVATARRKYGEDDARATPSAVVRRAIRLLAEGQGGCEGGKCRLWSAYHGHGPEDSK